MKHETGTQICCIWNKKGRARELVSFPRLSTVAANMSSVLPTTLQWPGAEYVLKNKRQPSFLRASYPTYCPPPLAR